MNKITKTGKAGLQLIMDSEGFSPDPYPDPATNGLPITIGYGSTRWENGDKITLKSPSITQLQARNLLAKTISVYENAVDAYCIDTINQNQFDALVSFVYNLGATNFKSSTLLKKINKNPNDPTIKDEFLKWNKAAGKIMKGLTKRREAEAKLYFS